MGKRSLIGLLTFIIRTQTAAAQIVENEDLGPEYTGILGLALPQFSKIAQLVPPRTDNNPDGATLASNIFSITPVAQAPASHFLSLVLAYVRT